MRQPLVDVVAPEMGVGIGSLDFNEAFATPQNGDIEGATAKVVHGDGLVLLFVESISKGSRGGLIDDALHVETGNLASILRRLALSVVKVCRYRDDGFVYLLAEIVFCGRLQLLQDHR